MGTRLTESKIASTESKITPETILPCYRYRQNSSQTRLLMKTKTLKLLEFVDGINIFRFLLQDWTTVLSGAGRDVFAFLDWQSNCFPERRGIIQSFAFHVLPFMAACRSNLCLVTNCQELLVLLHAELLRRFRDLRCARR